MSKITLEAEIKSNIGKVNQETAQMISNFGAFGITVGVVRDKFKELGKIAGNVLTMIKLQAQLGAAGLRNMFAGNVIAGAKTLFKVIATGVAATGVGALLIAFTSLVTFFTRTEKGAEKLKVAFAGVGAAVSVIVDRIADFGGAILKFFKRDFSGAAEDMKAAFSGIGKEIKEDTELMMALQRATNALRDSERDLGVETAQRRAEIEELKMIAEDVTKTEKERLDAAKEAFNIEQNLLDKRVENAEKAVEIARMQTEASHSSEEDLDNLAQLEINLANIRAESATKQIELNNKINAIEAETERKRQEAHDKQMARLKEEEDARNDMLTGQGDRFERQVELQEKFETENTLMAIGNSLEREKKKLEIEREAQVNSLAYKTNTDEVKAAMDINYQMKSNALDRAIEQSKKDLANAELQAFSQLAGALSTLAGDNKELAAASAIISTYAGATKAFEQGGTLGFVSSAAIILQGLANVKRIYQTDVGTGVGGSTPSDTTPTRQFVSGSFDLNAQGGMLEPDPIQAYVVTDDMTNSQNKLAQIRRRATI
tara:strand:+ start:1521 stop:3152 length:1632 start_codon:yes stop_codon:yes gene_type:complete